MKKIILTLAILTFSLCSAYAQRYATDKGVITPGGSLAFSSQSSPVSGGSSTTTFSLMPEIGYFFIPNLETGAKLNISTQSSGGSSVTQFGIGPYVAYFFAEERSKLLPFIRGGFTYNSVSYTGSTTLSITTFQIAGGLGYLIAKNVALGGALYIDFNSYSQGGASGSTTTFGIYGSIKTFIF